jgi:hypothetical protein
MLVGFRPRSGVPLIFFSVRVTCPNSRAHVEIGGRGYLFVTEAIEPLFGNCGVPADWALFRDGFLHPAPDGG